MLPTITNSIKEFFGEDNEFVESTSLALKERITSPFYGYFIVSWCVINWKLIYVAFFVAQDSIYKKYDLLRVEYLTEKIFPNNYHYLLCFWIYPLVSTILLFWVFPYLTRVYFRKSVKNKIALKNIELQEIKKIKKIEKEVIQEETKIIKEGVQKAKEEKKAAILAPEVLWEKEFKNLTSNIIFNELFQTIITSVYEYSGNIKVENYGSTIFHIPTQLLVYADTNEIIKLDKSKDKIELTDKGRYFVKEYTQRKL